MIVVDTNVIAYFLIKGDRTPLAEAIFEKDAHWAAPVLWRSEMRSVLTGYLRRGLFTLADAKELMSDAEVTLRGNEYDVDSARTLELADLSGCTTYDCEFVCVAEALSASLVTSDSELLAAFPSIAVSMSGFAK